MAPSTKMTLQNEHKGPHTFWDGPEGRTVQPDEIFRVSRERGVQLLEHFPDRFTDITDSAADPYREERAPVLDDPGAVRDAQRTEEVATPAPSFVPEPGKPATIVTHDEAAVLSEAEFQHHAEVLEQSPFVNPAAKFVVTESNGHYQVSPDLAVTIPPGEYSDDELKAKVAELVEAAKAAPPATSKAGVGEAPAGPAPKPTAAPRGGRAR